MDKPSLLVNGEILLYGDVGDPYCWGDGFTVTDVASALAEHGPGDVPVRLNSGGGIAFDGVAIYSLLRSHEGKVHVIVDGIAASAASLILMAGDTREMRDGAMVMIHDAAGLTFGTAADHQRDATVLDKLSDQYAGIYAARSGLEREEVRSLMRAETWFTADEAVAQGLVTGKAESLAEPTASFNYRLYARAPKGLPSRFKPQAAPAATASAAEKEPPMSDVKPAPTPAPKAWATDFFAAAGESNLSIVTLLDIVAKADGLDAAKASMTEAVAAKKAADEAAAAAAAGATPPETKPEPVAPVASAPKAWSVQFFTAAEKSGLGLATLNGIVAQASNLEVAKDALIDAMAAAQASTKPSPAGGHHGGGSTAKDDKAGGIVAAYRKAGGRTRADAAAR